jgi:hypothetical protein
MIGAASLARKKNNNAAANTLQHTGICNAG